MRIPPPVCLFVFGQRCGLGAGGVNAAPESAAGDYQDVTVAAAGQQTILDRGGVAEMMDEVEAGYEKCQDDDDAQQAGGLALFRFTLRSFVQPWPMLIQAELRVWLAVDLA